MLTFTGHDWNASCNVSPLAGNLHACYSQKVNDQLTVAAELETSLRLQESTATIAYQVEIPNAHTTFKGMTTASCIKTKESL
jgi:mitochondrial import receptor subunit TOM40